MCDNAETIRQLIDTICRHLPGRHTGKRPSLAELDALIAGELSRAPRYIALVMNGLACLFNLFAVFRWGSTFRSLSRERQQVHYLSWKVSAFGIKRDFINFFESFVLLGVYEEYDADSFSPARAVDHAGRAASPGSGNPS